MPQRCFIKIPLQKVFFFKENCIIRVQDYLKNIRTVLRYFNEKFEVDPPIKNEHSHFIGIKAVVKPLYRSKTIKPLSKRTTITKRARHCIYSSL